MSPRKETGSHESRLAKSLQKGQKYIKIYFFQNIGIPYIYTLLFMIKKRFHEIFPQYL